MVLTGGPEWVRGLLGASIASTRPVLSSAAGQLIDGPILDLETVLPLIFYRLRTRTQALLRTTVPIVFRTVAVKLALLPGIMTLHGVALQTLLSRLTRGVRATVQVIIGELVSTVLVPLSMIVAAVLDRRLHRRTLTPGPFLVL